MNYQKKSPKSQIPTNLGHLLYEISWEGNAKNKYREGGRGRENVLTTEVLQILDWLPRKHFLGSVVRSMHGAKAARKNLVLQIEKTNIVVLPDAVFLKPSKRKYEVQPDGLLESPSVFCFIEAKRLRRGAFSNKQLARELVATILMAEKQTPLLALLLPNIPPVSVKGAGRLTIEEAVNVYIKDAIEKEAENFPFSVKTVQESIDATICWITWDELLECIKKQLASFTNESTSVVNTVSRMVDDLDRVIQWHR